MIDTPKGKRYKIIGYFKNQNISRIHHCYCIDFKAKIELAKEMNIDEIGAGFIYTI